MAKKKSTGWLPPEETTEAAAKEVIKKTTKSKPVSHKGRPEGNTRGPKRQEEEITRIAVRSSDRQKLKTLAAMKDQTIIEYFGEMVKEAWKKRFD